MGVESSSQGDGGVLKDMLDCNCFAPALSYFTGDTTVEDKEASLSRLDKLKTPQRFSRKAWGGLSSQELEIQLTDDNCRLKWSTVKSKAWINTQSDEYGVIDLTTCKACKLNGEKGMKIIGPDDKPVLDVTTDVIERRDSWVLALQELLEGWRLDPSSRPTVVLEAKDTSAKNEYFANREEILREKQRERQEKKKKYMSDGNGMRHTAMVMANRS